MLSTIITALQAKLAPVAESVTGDTELPRQDTPPRFAFIRKGFKSAGPSSIGLNPRSLGDRVYAVEVRCWGKDEDEADRLSLALETAAREVLRGRNYTLPSGDFIPLNDSHRGVVCVCDLTIRLTVPAVRLESGAPDDVKPTTTMSSFGLDPSSGTAGDAEYQPGD